MWWAEEVRIKRREPTHRDTSWMNNGHLEKSLLEKIQIGIRVY